MNIAIIFGGSSFEHEISIVSTITVKKLLKKDTVSFIFVSDKREFYLIEPENMKAVYFQKREYLKAKKLLLDGEGFSVGGLFGKKQLALDGVINLIHGRDGEDGKIAGLLSFYGIRAITPSLEASVLSYNKLYTKLFAQSIGVKVLDFQHISAGDEDKTLKLSLPVIVKPVRLGSSIGVSIVREQSEFDYALDSAFEYDSDVIVEPFIEGVREFNQAGAKGAEWMLSIIEEPQKEEFLDFEKKYMDFSRNETTQSASVEASLAQKIQESFKRIYEPLFEGALIRCDFFVIDDEVYLNEINPIPGSMANYLFEDFESVIESLFRDSKKESSIAIDYRYISSINQAKGKA